MICSKCGKEIQRGALFCDECGTAVENGNPNSQVVNNFYQPAKQPISVGGWIGRSLIPMIPFVGWLIYLIMLFVWSGDKNKEESFNNWAKAQLCVMLIGVILVVITIVIITTLGVSFYI